MSAVIAITVHNNNARKHGTKTRTKSTRNAHTNTTAHTYVMGDTGADACTVVHTYLGFSVVAAAPSGGACCV